MNDQQFPPLPAAIERLLRAEREAPAPPAAVAARVFRRVGKTVGLPAGAGRSLLLSGKGYLIAALIAAGAGGILWGTRPRTHGPTPDAEVETVVLTPVGAEPVMAPPVAGPAADPPPARAAVPARATTRPRVPDEDTLAAESALLIAARRSLGAGDAGAALARLRVHGRRWPRGALQQEREILAIQALAQQGQGAAAAARARQFLQRFPDSALAEVARGHTGE